MITLSLHAGRIVARTPYRFKDVCKALPGAKWTRAERAWTYPADLTTAAQVHDAFVATHTPVQFGTADAEQLFADAQAAKEKRQNALQIDPDELPPLKNAITPPWPHQRRGIHLIQNNSATLLMWEMGSGKTLAVVDAVGEGPDASRTLVLGPKVVLGVWPDEFRKHTRRTVDVVSPGGDPRQKNMPVAKRVDLIHRRLAIPDDTPRVAVVNYDACWREPMKSYLLGAHWDMLVCDEIHRLKAPGGRASKFVAQLAKQIPTRVGLTGTFMPHSPLDAYAQYRVLDPGIFGTSFGAYKRRYAIMGGYVKNGKPVQVIGWQNEAELNRKIYSIADRVLTDDVLDLPPFSVQDVSITLEPHAKRVYADLARDYVAGVQDGVITASNALSKLLRLRQVASGIAMVEDAADPTQVQQVTVSTAKRDYLTEWLGDLDPAEPVAVFYAFRPDAVAIRHAVEASGRQYFELSGDRNELAAWQADTGGSVLAAQIQSGCESASFVRACYQWYYTPGLNRGHYDQSLMRIRRHGQTRPVRYYRFVTTGTVEPRIYRAFDRGRDVAESILSWITADADGGILDFLTDRT